MVVSMAAGHACQTPSCTNQDTASGTAMLQAKNTSSTPSTRRTGNRSRMDDSLRNSEESCTHAEEALHFLHQTFVGQEEHHVVIALNHGV